MPRSQLLCLQSWLRRLVRGPAAFLLFWTIQPRLTNYLYLGLFIRKRWKYQCISVNFLHEMCLLIILFQEGRKLAGKEAVRCSYSWCGLVLLPADIDGIFWLNPLELLFHYLVFEMKEIQTGHSKCHFASFQYQ